MNEELKPDPIIQQLAPVEALHWLYQQFVSYNQNKICWTDVRNVMLNASLLLKKFKQIEEEVPSMKLGELTDAFIVAYDDMIDRSVIDDEGHLLDQEVDDVGVGIFAVAMKQKLKLSREAKGRRGWPLCSTEKLWVMLREHVEKGDVVDIANIAMMIWHVDRRDDAAIDEIIG